VNPSKYRSKYVSKTGRYVDWDTGNVVHSNIVGYYDRANNYLSKDRHDEAVKKHPCRTTAFTEKNADLWESSLPLIKKINAVFAKLAPAQYQKQHHRAHQTPFVIANTAYSTITVNYNWRTALHKDAGDFKEGLCNLAVFEEGKYTGGLLGFPQYGVAIDVREGDFLAMDCHSYHCNTPMQGIATNDDDADNEDEEGEASFTRLSMVLYLRENMLKCRGSQEQEREDEGREQGDE
jgi:hypothetical protein